MIRFSAFRPSPAMVVALIALFVSLSGVTYAALTLPKASVGSKQLKKQSVTTKKLKNGAVTTSKLRAGAVTGSKVRNGSLSGADIDLAKLGKVPNAALADRASSVDQLRLIPFTRVSPSATAATTAAARAAATEVPLGGGGPFQVYGKCFVHQNAGNPEVHARTFIRTSQDGSVFEGDNSVASGDPVDGFGGLDSTPGTQTFLNDDTVEPNREINGQNTFVDPVTPANTRSADLDADDNASFSALAPGGAQLLGYLSIGVKRGSIPAGEGPYGPGDACIFFGFLMS